MCLTVCLLLSGTAKGQIPVKVYVDDMDATIEFVYMQGLRLMATLPAPLNFLFNVTGCNMGTYTFNLPLNATLISIKIRWDNNTQEHLHPITSPIIVLPIVIHTPVCP